MQLCSLILPNNAALSVPWCSALDQKTARAKTMTPKKVGKNPSFHEDNIDGSGENAENVENNHTALLPVGRSIAIIRR